MRIGILTIVLLWLMACSDKGSIQNNAIDIPAFFKLEMSRLTQQKCKLNKSLQFKNQLTEVNNNQVQWEKELRPFLALKFPGFAQINDYNLVTIQFSPNARIIQLKAVNKLAQYSFIELLLINEKLYAITTYQSAVQLFSHSKAYLRYQSGHFYQIQSDNQFIGMQRLNYTIHGKISN
jgi:hypothetical protein